MRYLYLFIPILYMLASCTEEHREEELLQPRRTVLVYMAGDNNLSDETYIKADSITAGWHNRRDNLLIYRDARGGKGTPSLMRVVADDVNPRTEVVKEYPEDNSAGAEVFSGVVQDALSLYPAQSYGLLVFSHGTGWLPAGMFETPRSVSARSIMEDNGREMELADFAAAIPDHTFGFIVLEACLMAGVEVAYELRSKADYLVASSAEILSPGFSPVYPELINYLFEDDANLKGFIHRYYDYCNALPDVYRSATLSLIDLRAMDALAEVTRTVFEHTESKTMETGTVQSFDRGSHKLFFDFGDYMEQLNPALYPKVKSALSKAVLYKAATPSFVNVPIVRHSGLAVYMEQANYPELNRAYHRTAWYGAVSGNADDAEYADERGYMNE
ncbi:clostripain-related cysteine peptidase [Parabacteroides bouchesdurhonensis]|uniref:clostripain-related cysteine peptidase n=1 Tax=Parabacteroides bouchesdurhonensis TaxID=1936995 RepID=UPI0022E80875|nr:clostripain-related cysteine peptidase [Parabacteroides bouchesdurhonensis]